MTETAAKVAARKWLPVSCDDNVVDDLAAAFEAFAALREAEIGRMQLALKTIHTIALEEPGWRIRAIVEAALNYTEQEM